MTLISDETAQSWRAQAQADFRLQSIITDVEAKYELSIRIVDDTEWWSSVDGQKAVIAMTATARPMAAFAHELLHLRLSARGYRHILGSANHEPAKNQVISGLLSALDNELQHHRMFPAFLSAGFSAREFYADSDDISYEAIQRQIGTFSSNTSAACALYAYLPLIAPGGGWPTDMRDSVVDDLTRSVSAQVWQRLQAVKVAIDAWAGSDELDPTNAIVTILEALGEFDGTYITEDISLYPAGAFVPRSMTQAQFEELAAK